MSLWTTRVLFLLAFLLIGACGGGSPAPTGPGGRTPALSQAHPYVAGSPYADVLAACVDLDREPRSCTVGALPPLGRDDDDPDVDTILDRVVVSHDWMGDRFATILESQPDELRQLLRAITAIVIADDVRPSFYSATTGAIYIDPRHLWLTADEEATVSDQSDFRSGFGSELDFVPFAAYFDGATPAFGAGSPSGRDLNGRIRAVAALLFHEGAHANDFLPPSALPSLQGQETFFDVTERLEDRRLTEQLIDRAPLDSEVWRELGAVLYLGEKPTESLRELTAEEVGQAFAADGASDPYAYSSTREDFAMLFEQTMMKRHFDLERRVGFATQTVDENPRCSDYVVGWATSNRLAVPRVGPRARLVAELVLGDPLDDFFASLGAPPEVEQGGDLCVAPGPTTASTMRWM